MTLKEFETHVYGIHRFNRPSEKKNIIFSLYLGIVTVPLLFDAVQKLFLQGLTVLAVKTIDIEI